MMIAWVGRWRLTATRSSPARHEIYFSQTFQDQLASSCVAGQLGMNRPDLSPRTALPLTALASPSALRETPQSLALVSTARLLPAADRFISLRGAERPGTRPLNWLRTTSALTTSSAIR